MSTWGIGDNNDTDQVLSLKTQLLAKDADYGTVQGQLLKKEAELAEIKNSFNDVLSKLRNEADRVVTLETDLKRRTNDLQTEKITRNNAENALTAIHKQIEVERREARQLQTIIDAMSNMADDSTSTTFKLKQENVTLQKKIRDLEANLKERPTPPPPVFSLPSVQPPSQPDPRITFLEHELGDIRTRYTEQETHLRTVKEQSSKAQADLVKIENEKAAIERRLQARIDELQVTLVEREKDLQHIRTAQGGEDMAAREEQLLERLEDEELKVAELEKQLAHARNNQNVGLAFVKQELVRVQHHLAHESRKAQESEAKLVDLVTEKETALDELDEARMEIESLVHAGEGKQQQIKALTAQNREIEAQLTNATRSLAQARAAAQCAPPSAQLQEETAETAATVERLLGAIERLREERDSLRRDIEFLHVETRFSVQSLEAQLAAATSTPVPMDIDNSAALQSLQTEVHALQDRLIQAGAYTAVVHRKLHFSGRALEALAIVFQHAASERDVWLVQIHDLSDRLGLTQAKLGEVEAYSHQQQTNLSNLQGHNVTVEAKLSSSEETLQEVESQLSVFKAEVNRLELDMRKERSAREDVNIALAQAETQVSDLGKALEEAESQRDSLSLQLKHLEQDLATSREELSDAEQRYSTLQATQLSTLSGSQATRALRTKIEELEARILRRTEQIGIHQHDIKRLETNLRLQEERVIEMTSELEVVERERDTMVDDCSNTRDQRDDALRKCEELEEELEKAEDRCEKLEAERERELATMVGVVAEATGKRRSVRRALSQQILRLGDKEANLATIARQAEDQRLHTLQQLERLTIERDSAAEREEATAVLLTSAQRERDVAIADIDKANQALNAIQTEISETTSALQAAEEAQTVATANLEATKKDLIAKMSELTTLRDEYMQTVSRMEETQTNQDVSSKAQIEALEEKLRGVQAICAEMETKHQLAIDELTRSNHDLQNRLADAEAQTHVRDDLRTELERLQTEHSTKVGELQFEVARITAELADTQLGRSNVKAELKQVQAELQKSKEDLEIRLADATQRLHTSANVESELSRVQADHKLELDGIQEQLDNARKELDNVTKARGDLETQHQHLLEEFEARQVEVTEQVQRGIQLESDITQLREDHSEALSDLQQRLEAATKHAEDALSASSKLETELQHADHERAQSIKDVQARLDSSLQTEAQLREEIQSLSAVHAQDQEALKVELQTALRLRDTAELAQEKLRQEISAARTSLEEVDSSLQVLQEEKLTLQEETTNLQAEVQRSLSLQRYVESQLKDSEREVASLRSQLERTQKDYVQAEKNSKTAEINLTLQAVEHERTVSALNRQLEALQANASLEETIAELQQRQDDMEELLKNKNIEIEENDDRFIEMLKEKKKLTSKIDSLNRKVHNLQTKLAAINSMPANKSPSSSYPSTSKATPPPVPQLPLAMPSRTPTTTTPNTRSRTASSSSTLPRPKTPEARVPQQPVFRARTPESQRIPSWPVPQSSEASSSSSSSIGKKRRVPDDFEDGGNLPPQGFTTDSVPSTSVESNTPRVRRALHSVRSGFTPVRNGITRSNMGLGSPTRRTTTGAPPPTISDVTNSPRASDSRAGKATKRGWLGKIRGAPGAVPHTAFARPVFDRTQGDSESS